MHDPLGPRHRVETVNEPAAGGTGVDHQVRVGLGRYLNERDFLQITPVVARLHPEAFSLRLEELQREYGTTERELDLWAQVLNEIELQMTRPTFQTWFPQTFLLSVKDGQALIGVPNELAKEWLENRLRQVGLMPARKESNNRL